MAMLLWADGPRLQAEVASPLSLFAFMQTNVLGGKLSHRPKKWISGSHLARVHGVSSIVTFHRL